MIGNTTYTLLSSLISPDKLKDKSFATIADVFQHHFDPDPLVIAERFHFYRRNQGPGETINNYVAKLR